MARRALPGTQPPDATVSPGCDNCYAMTIARRLKGMGSEKYQRDGDPRTSGPGFGVSIHPTAVDAPLSWTKPRKVFVNSERPLPRRRPGRVHRPRLGRDGPRWPAHLPDPDQAAGSDAVVDELCGVRKAVIDEFNALPIAGPAIRTMSWPLRNVWLGVSVEDQKRADLRIRVLLGTPAAVRFLSCEPLLGAVDLAKSIEPNFAVSGWKDLSPLHWVIAGGESGPGARPMHPEWARSLRDQCQAGDVPVFVNSSVAHGPHKGGDMGTWPTELQVREYPATAA